MIKESGEFVLNLNTQKLAAASDQCGVISARECPDKWALTGLTRGRASHLKYAPIIMESPLNIECRLKDIIPLGSHHMFLGEVVGINASEEWADPSGGSRVDRLFQRKNRKEYPRRQLCKARRGHRAVWLYRFRGYPHTLNRRVV